MRKIFAATAFAVLGRVQFSLVVAGNGRLGESGKPSNIFSLMLSFEDLVGLGLIESADDIERVVFRRGRIFVEGAQQHSELCGIKIEVSSIQECIIELFEACSSSPDARRVEKVPELKTANPVAVQE